MEFFELFSIPGIIVLDLISLIARPEIKDVYDFSNFVLSYYLITGLCALGIYLVLLIFGGIGLNKLAKKQGLKHRFMAFLPFVNTYYAGKLAGETQFFGQKMKRVGLYAMLSEIAYVALQIFVLIAKVIFCFPQYITLEITDMGTPAAQPNANMPSWVEPSIAYGGRVAYLLWFFVLIFFCVLYIAFFRKYYARAPILLTFLSCVLPFRGFTIFAVRNNAPVDYNDYIRRRTQAYMRGNGPYGPQNGPYGGNGPYGPQSGPYGGNTQNNAPDPFEGFGGPENTNSGGSGGSNSSDDDPFSEFNDKK